MRSPRPTARLAVAWSLVALAAIAGVVVDATLSLRYGGGRVHLRPWLQTVNLGVALGHTVALAVMLTVVVNVRGWLRAPTAVAAWIVAAAAAAASLLVPLLLGEGPWSHDATPVAVLTALAFAPCLLRDVAFVSLFLGRERNLFEAVAAALMTLSIGLTASVWFATPVDVMMHVHVLSGVSLVPWLSASALAMLSWSAVREA